MRTHTGEKPFKCDVCKHSFNVKSNFAMHMRTHTGEKPFKCDACKRSFTQKGHLAEHMRIHTGEKPFKCDVCKRSFNHKSTLTIHMRTHTGEKPFKCDICKHNFNQKGNLAIHMRIHTGEKPFNASDRRSKLISAPSNFNHISHMGPGEGLQMQKLLDLPTTVETADNTRPFTYLAPRDLSDSPPGRGIRPLPPSGLPLINKKSLCHSDGTPGPSVPPRRPAPRAPRPPDEDLDMSVTSSRETLNFGINPEVRTYNRAVVSSNYTMINFVKLKDVCDLEQ
ncbi:hypothetical protein QYM36_016207 [Artemia franciscana]|uniref:Uncharacterized protein n=1 Tax=Artemia franciscana TaxID=6661 RepID=A0AA88KXX3_ARTSF|nr:hypothetical protein QYM36_016207 [Artemia franciscana]